MLVLKCFQQGYSGECKQWLFNKETRVRFIYGLLTKRGVKMYGLLTKCEVKMAGYWPSSFFACLWT